MIPALAAFSSDWAVIIDCPALWKEHLTLILLRWNLVDNSPFCLSHLSWEGGLFLSVAGYDDIKPPLFPQKTPKLFSFWMEDIFPAACGYCCRISKVFL